MAIQIDATPLREEGIGTVLDTVQDRAGATTLFLATPTWSHATGGPPAPGRPLPGHGKEAADRHWVGGNYATVHPEYYPNTVLGPAGQAPEHPGWDLLAEVVPAAKERGLQSFVWIDESSHAHQLRGYPNFLKCLEVDIWNKPARRPCFNNPDYRNWHLGLIEDYLKSYDLDGIAWSSERIGPLNMLLQAPTRQGLGLISCYCRYCKELGAERGIDWRRAQEGYRKLVTWNAGVARGECPADGAFVTFWRLLLTFPEMVSWHTLWTDSQHQLYRDIYGIVKAYKPTMQVGWNLGHEVSFSPFQRADQSYSDLSHFSDFLKVATYDACAGPRFHAWVEGICRSLFADAPVDQVYPVLSRILGLDEAPYDELPEQGFSPEYVRRETERAVLGSEGRCEIYAGIDVDIPVGAPADAELLAGLEARPVDTAAERPSAKADPERIRSAVLAAFEGGASGVVLSRKYSEMRLDNLSGVGAALAEVRA